MYIIRLDDAAKHMDLVKWDKMEHLLNKYNVKPIVGVIPNIKDVELIKQYKAVDQLWDIVKRWNENGWNIAMHGYDHCYLTESGGMNPVNKRSEFAGVSLEEQLKKINSSIVLFKEQGITPKVFFAPSHTFDLNTLVALNQSTSINTISDTVANKPYTYKGFNFIPQQYSSVRKSSFAFTTFCYHPNLMEDSEFESLEEFLKLNHETHVNDLTTIKYRKRTLYDLFLRSAYFNFRRVRSMLSKNK